MKISWVILTHNRFDIVDKAFDFNFDFTNSDQLIGIDWEIIWVDNGSSDVPGFYNNSVNEFAEIKLLFSENRGVAKGYNAGMAMATGDYILITGCDRLMPAEWMSRFLACFDSIPNTGIISCYSKPLHECADRWRRSERTGQVLVECLPFEAKIFKRELLSKIGYLHEGFGLYGFEDCEWASRAMRVTKELGLINYTLPNFTAKHLGTEGIQEWDGKDAKDYHEFKQREVKDPAKQRLFDELARKQFPYYNPFV